MAFRTRKPFKQADRFLAQFEEVSPADFRQVVGLLGAFKRGEVDKLEVFDFVVGVAKRSPDLLARFNAFLNPDRQVALLADWRIQRLIEHLMKHTNELFCADDRFNGFMNLFHSISNRMDEQGIIFLSYDEALAYFSREMAKEDAVQAIGRDIMDAAQRILRDYVEAAKASPPELSEDQADARPATATADPPPAPDKKPRPTDPKPKKLQRSGDWAPPKPKPSRPAAKVSPAADSRVDPEPPAPIPAGQDLELGEDRRPENLKVELNVFRALRKRLGEPAFASLAKAVELYRLNVVSYVELVKLAEQVLFAVDRKLLLCLREVLETRDARRTAANPFNLKQCTEELPGLAENSSYSRVVSPFPFASRPALLNKTFVAIATGNEAVANFEDQPLKKASKNLAEEALFRVEDEMHEFDSNIAQLRCSLGLLAKLQRDKLTPEAIAAVCAKLRTVRALALIYGAKAPKIADKLRQRPKELLDLVAERLAEKLDLLVGLKREFADRAWLPKSADNFYKALDARSNSIKAYEKTLLGTKHLLLALRAAAADRRGIVLAASLHELVHDRPEPRLSPSALPVHPGPFANPVLALRFADPQIAKDVLHLAGVSLRQAKTNFDKKKAFHFLRRAFLDFLDLDPSDARLDARLLTPEDLTAELAAVERTVYPAKDFYFHEKVRVEFVKDATRAFNDVFLRDFAFQELFRPDIHVPSHPQFHSHSQAKPEPDDSAVPHSHPHQPVAPPANIQPADPLDPRRAFFGGTSFYVVFRYFHLLYERFEFVRDVSRETSGGDRLYRLYFSLAAYHALGELDYTNFENAVITLFDRRSGVLLNLDRLLQHFFKAIPSDDAALFAARLHPSVFGDGPTPDPEPVLFAKTCRKLTETALRENKAQKNQYSTAHGADLPVEVFKFEWVPAARALAVHSFESAFKVDGREVLSFQTALLHTCGDLLTTPRPAHRSPRRLPRFTSGDRVYALNVARKRLVALGQGTEEQVWGDAGPTTDFRHRKIAKLTRTLRFRRALGGAVSPHN